MDRVDLHNVWELAAAIVVSLIATVLKFGDRTQLGAVWPPRWSRTSNSSAGAIVWSWAAQQPGGLQPAEMALVVSMSGGALLANWSRWCS